MSRGPPCMLAIAAAAVLTNGAAHARPRLGVEAYGGWSQHAMGAVNDSLRSLNDQIGTRLDPIHGGPTWGVGVRIWPHRDVLLRLGFERLEAESEDSDVRFDLSAHAYTLSGTYYIPTQLPLRYGFGLGLGPYYPSGGLTGSGVSLETSGEGFGGRATAEAILPIGNGWSVSGVLGYRWAAVSHVQFAENTSDMRVEYSGFYLRFGLAVDGEPQTRSRP